MQSELSVKLKFSCTPTKQIEKLAEFSPVYMFLKLAQLNLIFSINIHNIVYELPFIRKKKSIVLYMYLKSNIATDYGSGVALNCIL